MRLSGARFLLIKTRAKNSFAKVVYGPAEHVFVARKWNVSGSATAEPNAT